MRKLISILALIFAATAAFAGVTVSAPANGATVGSPVHFVASATGSTTIASMIVYVDGNQDYLVYSNNVDTYISLGSGNHTAVVRAWDNWGGVYSQTVNFTAGTASSSTSTAPTSSPTSSGGTGVIFSAPANGATVGSPVQVNASASGYSAASMILYVDGNEAYRTYSGNVSTSVPLGNGSHNLVINSWDNYGKLYTSKETITVGSTSSASTTPTSSPTPVSSTTTSSSGPGVYVSSPSAGSSTGSPVHFVANAVGASSIASMMLYVDGNDNKLVYSNSLDTSVSLGNGGHNAVIKAWDNSGHVYSKSVNFTVGSGSTTTTSTASAPTTSTTGSGAVTYSQIQAMGGWDSCTVCAGDGGNGPVAGYDTNQHQGSPSLSGDATKYSLWGSTPYSDVLWWKQLVDGDYNPAAVKAAHHFVYDAWFYIDNPGAAQALEFDINQFVNGHSLIMGTQCNIRNGGVWDVWDIQGSHWVHTGKSCTAPSAYTWHHVVIETERANDGGDWAHYVSIEMDGNKTYIDAWYPPAGTSWNGITVNFQMDGNYAEQSYNVWLDKFSLTTW